MDSSKSHNIKRKWLTNQVSSIGDYVQLVCSLSNKRETTWEKYCLPRPTIIFICNMIADTANHWNRRSMALYYSYMYRCPSAGIPPTCQRCRSRIKGHGLKMSQESVPHLRRCCWTVYSVSNRTGVLRCKPESHRHRKYRHFNRSLDSG